MVFGVRDFDSWPVWCFFVPSKPASVGVPSAAGVKRPKTHSSGCVSTPTAAAVSTILDIEVSEVSSQLSICWTLCSTISLSTRQCLFHAPDRFGPESPTAVYFSCITTVIVLCQMRSLRRHQTVKWTAEETHVSSAEELTQILYIKSIPHWRPNSCVKYGSPEDRSRRNAEDFDESANNTLAGVLTGFYRASYSAFEE